MDDIRDRPTLPEFEAIRPARLYAIRRADGKDIAAVCLDAFTWAGAHRWLADHPEFAYLDPRVVPL